ncbi:MAG: imidazolonepropionase [Nitrospiria bacterium]
MSTIFDIAIIRCGELLTLSGASTHPKRRAELADVGLILNGAIGISGEKIAWVGSEAAYRQIGRAKLEIDAGGKVVMPGLVDPHTHAVFAGSREGEWEEKMRGVSYLEILEKGGGILRTVDATRAASPEHLLNRAKKTLKKMLSHGTTTVEIKSGYGLDQKNELKLLEVIQKLKEETPLDVVLTFLGAHAIPREYLNDPDAYVDLVIGMLSEVKPGAQFCDVFCEEGAFSYAQTRRVLAQALITGYQVKLHAGEFSDQGGIRLAVEFGAVSVDHLDAIQENEIPLLAESGAVGVLLPGVSHFLRMKEIPPARALIEGGVPIALASDFNPGSCPSLSMQEMIHLAVRNLGLSTSEAIAAATINAAHAIGMASRVGSLEVGKQADLLLLDIDHYQQLPYYFGLNHVDKVIKKGKMVL